MADTPLEPFANAIHLGESSNLRAHRYSNRFSVVRVQTTAPLRDAVQKSSSVPALLLSTFVRPVATATYLLWIDGKRVPVGHIPAFRANLIDLATEPAIWGGSGIDHVHFHLRRDVIDDTAAMLGYERVGEFRASIASDDLVLAQLTKNLVPFLGSLAPPSPLALDQVEQIVAAHVLQRYAVTRPRRGALRSGLAAWQGQRAKELLRENLDGKIRLAELARACDLSVSHFSRMFKMTFGVSCHRWLTERRIERAQALLERTNAPLVDISSQAGFGDQAAFARTFRRVVGVTPSSWRREHGRSRSR